MHVISKSFKVSVICLSKFKIPRQKTYFNVENFPSDNLFKQNSNIVSSVQWLESQSRYSINSSVCRLPRLTYGYKSKSSRRSKEDEQMTCGCHADIIEQVLTMSLRGTVTCSRSYHCCNIEMCSCIQSEYSNHIIFANLMYQFY